MFGEKKRPGTKKGTKLIFQVNLCSVEVLSQLSEKHNGGNECNYSIQPSGGGSWAGCLVGSSLHSFLHPSLKRIFPLFSSRKMNILLYSSCAVGIYVRMCRMWLVGFKNSLLATRQRPSSDRRSKGFQCKN